MFAEFIDAYGLEIIWAIFTAVATFFGFVIKKLYTRYINDKIKQEVADTVVQGVEQMYKNLHGEEKLNKALEAAAEILTNKGITVSTFELKLLLEASVAKFNDAFNKTDAKTDVEEVTENEEIRD